jgi:transposase-like protein
MADRKEYSAEFRVAAAREVVSKSRPIVDVARELGVKSQTLGKWVRRLSEVFGPDHGRVVHTGGEEKDPRS